MKNPLQQWLTQEEQKVLYYLFVLFFLGITLHITGYETQRAKQQNVNTTQYDNVQSQTKRAAISHYDLRTITENELISLPVIGEKKAKLIITYRNQHGFKNLNELMNIEGIGEKSYKKLREYFLALGDTTCLKDEKKVKDKRKVLPKITTNEISINEKIDINRADVKELMKIKGIGSVKAKNIVEYRNTYGYFKNYEDLLKVDGIGEKTLLQMKSSIIIQTEKGNYENGTE